SVPTLFAALKGSCFGSHAAHGLARRVAAVRNTNSGRLLGCGPQPTSKTPPLAPATECYCREGCCAHFAWMSDRHSLRDRGFAHCVAASRSVDCEGGDELPNCFWSATRHMFYALN